MRCHGTSAGNWLVSRLSSGFRKGGAGKPSAARFTSETLNPFAVFGSPKEAVFDDEFWGCAGFVGT